MDPTNYYVANADEVTAQGIEIEGFVKPSENFTFSLITVFVILNTISLTVRAWSENKYPLFQNTPLPFHSTISSKTVSMDKSEPKLLVILIIGIMPSVVANSFRFETKDV